VAKGLADHLNRALNRTVSDSRLSIVPLDDDGDAFQLTRVVDREDAPLELNGTAARLSVQQLVVVEDGRCRTESYVYRLQADESPKSWLIRWEYARERQHPDYPYPTAHLHVNGTFPDGTPIDRQHIPAPQMPLELIIRYLISDRGVKSKSKNWEAILEDSAKDFGKPG
jgi:hypothetical protein